MKSEKIILNGELYDVAENSVIGVKGDLGNWVKIFADNYEIEATRISIDNGYSKFKIDKITYYDENGKPIIESQEQEETSSAIEYTFDDEAEYRKKLSKYKKNDLVDLLIELGVEDFHSKMKKQELIDILVEKHKNF